MILASILLSVPRQQPTLERSQRSLQAAGWPEAPIYRGSGAGHLIDYLGALERIVEENPDAAGYLLSEDDVVYCRGLRDYLQATLWPADPLHIGLVSPYTPEAYASGQRWHIEDRGFYLAGSQSFLFPAVTARNLLVSLGPARFGREQRGDYMIGMWCQAKNLATWYHQPSLAQHLGETNSVVGGPQSQVATIRHASTFVGEDFDARSLL